MKHLYELKKKLESVADTGVALTTMRGEFLVTPILKQGCVAGVDVSNLGASKFIPIDAFVAIISLLELSPDKRAINGNAVGPRLGEPELPFYSVEGHVAKIVYGRLKGDSVFKRITPISKILEWAGICEIVGRGATKGLRLID